MWEMEHIGWKSEWSKFIFLDLKKFNHDEEDGVTHYWQNICQYQKLFLVDIPVEALF